MKPLFDDEMARELGYQKWYPEKSDWILATIGCLLVGGLICGLMILAVTIFIK